VFPGVFEILLILGVLALVVIGPRRIANMGRSLGRGVYDFIDEIGNTKRDEELSEYDRDQEELDPEEHRKE
jgi:Sec-independent protein translocase protein TatA